jgi:hypothetical protein
LKHLSPELAVEEIYEAYKLEFHYPAEHYITIGGRTPRYEVELQIYHKLKKTNNAEMTNKRMKVNKAILSVFFTVGNQQQGDLLFNNLGIDRFNVNSDLKLNYPKEHSEIDNELLKPSSYKIGFNYSAVQGLLNLINYDPEMFFYYGSETSPPCNEDVLWMIFSKPRSIGPQQAKFIKKLIIKHSEKDRKKLFGNNRRIKVYNILYIILIHFCLFVVLFYLFFLIYFILIFFICFYLNLN